MDEMFVNIMSKDLHEIREDIGRQTGLLTEVKAAFVKVDALDSTANSLQQSLEVSLQDIGRLSKEIVSLYGVVIRLRQDLLKPLQQEHHHHFPKIAWVAIALLIGFSVAVGGWIQSSRAGREYRDADTKYRLLQLMQGAFDGKTLREVDSLVQLDPTGMRDSIEQVERAREAYWRTMEEAQRLKREGFGR